MHWQPKHFQALKWKIKSHIFSICFCNWPNFFLLQFACEIGFEDGWSSSQVSQVQVQFTQQKPFPLFSFLQSCKLITLL